MDFPKFESILLLCAAPKEVADAAVKWLDINKERDFGLLEKLSEIDKSKVLFYKIDFYEYVKQEIMPNICDELYQRYMIMAYKLLDASAYCLISFLRYEEWKHIKELFSREMENIYRDEAPARMLSVDCDAFITSSRYFNMPDDPELILKAAELTSEKHMITKAYLAAAALDHMSLPDDGKLSEKAEIAVTIIKNAMNNSIEKDNIFLLNALANASYFDEIIKTHFEEYAAANAEELCSLISRGSTDIERAADALFAVEGTFNKDVLFQLLRYGINEKLMISAAKMQTETFKKHMLALNNIINLVTMNDALKTTKPDEALRKDEVKKIAEDKIIESVTSCYKESDKIRAFIKDEITFDEVYSIIKSTAVKLISSVRTDYITEFGADEFILRCVIVLGGNSGISSSQLYQITGFSDKTASTIVEWCYSHNIDIINTLDICSRTIDNVNDHEYRKNVYADALSEHTDEIAAADLSKCNTVAKFIALKLFGNNETKYHKSIIALAGDTSKVIRDIVMEIVMRHPDWNDDIKVLLTSKKSSAREFALNVIERHGAKAYIQELRKALEAEKTDKLKARIGSMLAVVSENLVVEDKVSAEDTVKEMTKGKKASKLDWLFKEPFSPVHMKDGSVADESYLRALMLCFANSVGLKDPKADIITAELDEKDVCRLANEVLVRWLQTSPEVKSESLQFFEEFTGLETLGAQAKYKWVLYFASVYGGKEALEVFEDLMSTWPLWQKGALAKEIPHAIVLNGSSSYIMLVEKMSRKHRFNSIRKASADALLCASEKLGISKEEFADRMIPDLDFDKNMCRTFDYGSRRFDVYITPKLEPEIYCDGKKLKTMPKPSADEGTKAADVYKEFTAMKKLMKNIVDAQRVRLENTLLTARNWTAENWKQIFMRNPIMHCFAIGLIWGVYKDGRLESSFRYLDDGSLTTVDDEEFTLAENSVIGLVHPVELSEEELEKWKQQLKDYEIVQPFIQLGRGISRPTEEEKEQNFIGRFKGNVIKSREFVSAMNKIGWSKGKVGDGAIFDDFVREEIFSRNDGIRASLLHSGIPIEVFREKETDITVGKLIFETLPKQESIKIGDLSDRYFSEIMYQLGKIFAD